ncbi:MAG: DNA-directed RNA polymerase subunit beta' [Pseudomonadota bacterium]
MTKFINNLDNKDNYNTYIGINIASPEQIRKNSYGEISNSNTINYRTQKPDKGGLFCAKIFGPTEDNKCLCGKYKTARFKGIICEKCEVQVTSSSVRRTRRGHINLPTPIAHSWYLRSNPSRISTLLGMSLKAIENVLYFLRYIVVDPGMTELEFGDLLTEEEYHEKQVAFGYNSFQVMIGGEAIYHLLKNLNLSKMKSSLEKSLISNTSVIQKRKLIKLLRLVKGFLSSNSKPEYMMLLVLPVLPADLRPLVTLDGGNFAFSDLNLLYKTTVNRVNRLNKLLALGAPDIIIQNEKRMLQEAVDYVIENGKRSKSLKTSSNRLYKSLSDMIKGKQSLWRQYRLASRVDDSGRAVIIVGPHLRLHQCGLPRDIAIELFKTYLYGRILDRYTTNIKSAKLFITQNPNKVNALLNEIMQDKIVLLNRAPTLHKGGMQAFEPLLITGQSIQLHPLVCKAFNADFDGDQMAVIFPKSLEAQIEGRILMLSSKNIYSPANGKVIITPDKDIVLGLYYLSMFKYNESDKSVDIDKVYINRIKVVIDYENNILKIDEPIYLIVNTPGADGNIKQEKILTTAGRVKLSMCFPSRLNYNIFNRVFNINILLEIFDQMTYKEIVEYADKIKDLGFAYATKSGLSFSIDDLNIPIEKKDLVNNFIKVEDRYKQQCAEGLLTTSESNQKIIDSCTRLIDDISVKVEECLKVDRKFEIVPDEKMFTLSTLQPLNELNKRDKFIQNKLNSNISSYEQPDCKLNSVYAMMDSGARGSKAQINQLVGMIGLIYPFSGEVFLTPIFSNLVEGMKPLEWFISVFQRSFAGNAATTAIVGYATRRLVEVSHGVVITSYDCGTDESITVFAENTPGNDNNSLMNQVYGRVLACDITDLNTGDVILTKNTLLMRDEINLLVQSDISSVEIFTVLKCKAYSGACVKCYGASLGHRRLVDIGHPVGVEAAQSIGEPATQLSMAKSYALSGKIALSSLYSDFDYKAVLHNAHIAENSNKDKVVLSKNCEIVLIDKFNNERKRLEIPYGAIVYLDFSEKDMKKISKGEEVLKYDLISVKKNQKLAEWNPHEIQILSMQEGTVKYSDIIDNITLDTSLSGGKNNKGMIIITKYSKLNNMVPRLEVNNQVYNLGLRAILMVENDQHVKRGDLLARTLLNVNVKSKDISGGLNTMLALLEAKKHVRNIVLCPFDAQVSLQDHKNKLQITLTGVGNDNKKVLLISKDKDRVLVPDGFILNQGGYLLDGDGIDLQEMLDVLGFEKTALYIIRTLQSIYQSQGLSVNSKHFEIIVIKMMQKVKIVDSGDDNTVMIDEILLKKQVDEMNVNLRRLNKKPIRYMLQIEGITQAALTGESFLAAASFQEATKVLTEASTSGQVDRLEGIKENMILGRFIPVGSEVIRKFNI